MNVCVVFLCNKWYYPRFLQTYADLRERSKYTGPVCLVIGDDMMEVSVPADIIVKHFPDWVFPGWFHAQAMMLPRAEFLYRKFFQFHKFYLFDAFFKQWNYIFYIDAGMTIYQPIEKMLALGQPHTLLAHSDAYPTYEWKLSTQFCYPEIVEYPLNNDYFQTGIMIYDTEICSDAMPSQLYDLTLRYPSVRTNDQGIIALYFTQIAPVWKQITLGDADTNYYDYFQRERGRPYVMVKDPLM